MRLAGKPLVLRKIEIAARGDAFQFLAGQFAFGVAFAEGKFVKNVHRGAGVMRQFLRLLPVFDQADVRGRPMLFVKGQPLLDPVFVPHLPAPIRLRLARMPGACGLGHAAANRFDRFIGPDEKLQFHLLEFARAESEIARIDLVAKGLADLANAERHFLPRNFGHVFELRENGLRRFRAQIGHVLRAFHRARRTS